jgi:hypothetical protein
MLASFDKILMQLCRHALQTNDFQYPGTESFSSPFAAVQVLLLIAKYRCAAGLYCVATLAACLPWTCCMCSQRAVLPAYGQQLVMVTKDVAADVVQMPNTEVHREWRRSMDVERKAGSIRQLNFDAGTFTPSKQGAWYRKDAAKRLFHLAC